MFRGRNQECCREIANWSCNSLNRNSCLCFCYSLFRELIEAICRGLEYQAIWGWLCILFGILLSYSANKWNIFNVGMEILKWLLKAPKIFFFLFLVWLRDNVWKGRKLSFEFWVFNPIWFSRKQKKENEEKKFSNLSKISNFILFFKVNTYDVTVYVAT